jgi:integrase
MRNHFNDKRRAAAAKTAGAGRLRKALDDAQLDQLTQALGKQRGRHAEALRIMVEVMLASGARAHELAYANWENFDPNTGALMPVDSHCSHRPEAAMPLAAWQALAKLPEAPSRGRPVFPDLPALRVEFSRCVGGLDIPRSPLGGIRTVARARFAKAQAAPAAATPSEIATLPPSWLDALRASRVAPASHATH